MRMTYNLFQRHIASLCLALMLLQLIPAPVWALGNKPKANEEIQRHLAVLEEVSGSVEVFKMGGDGWAAGMNGTLLGMKESVRTGADGSASIRISDVAVVELAASTEIILRDLRQMRSVQRDYLIFARRIIRDNITIELVRGETRQSFAAIEGRVANYRIISDEGEVEAPGGATFSTSIEDAKAGEEANKSDTQTAKVASSDGDPQPKQQAKVVDFGMGFHSQIMMIQNAILQGAVIAAGAPVKLQAYGLKGASAGSNVGLYLVVKVVDADGKTVKVPKSSSREVTVSLI